MKNFETRPEFDISDFEMKDTFFVAEKHTQTDDHAFHVIGLIPLFIKNINGCDLTYFYGEATKSCSGAPVFNKYGKVIGMVETGYRIPSAGAHRRIKERKFYLKLNFN